MEVSESVAYMKNYTQYMHVSINLEHGGQKVEKKGTVHPAQRPI